MYSVADFIIRIKNASLSKRQDVLLPFSKLNKAIGKILVQEGFLESIKEETIDGKKTIMGKIRYEKRAPLLTDVNIVSKPSLRVYIPSKDIAKIERRGMVTAIFSTSKGVMTGKEAIKKGIGGELLFKIW